MPDRRLPRPHRLPNRSEAADSDDAVTDINRRQPPLSNDQLAAVLLIAGLVVLAFYRRHTLLRQLNDWLHDNQIVLPGTAGLQIPHLGGLDGPRLLIACGLLLLTVLTAKIAIRSRRPRA